MRLTTEIRRNAVLVALAASALASPAPAQLHDHLKCYKVKDTASFSALVDLRPLVGAPFEVDANCKVRVRSRQLCFPVQKGLVESSGPSLDVRGQELANAFLCYTVKCPASPVPQSLEMSDQFGTRTLTGLRTSTICAPAIYGAPPPTTTTTLPSGTPRDCANATPPNCDGTCNDFNFACRPNTAGDACDCAYVDILGGCPMTGSGVPECWGTCQGSQTCIEVSGACQCGFAFE